MTIGDGTITIDGTPVSEGTAIYDTDYDRVLWVADVDESGIVVETVTDYDVDDPVGWTPESGDRIKDGTVFAVSEFESLVRDGRFEVSPG